MKCIEKLKEIKFGWEETLFALSPLLGAYGQGVLRMEFIIPVLISYMCFRKNAIIWMPLYYKVFLIYILLHDIVLIFTMPQVPAYYFNNRINMFAALLAISIIGKTLDIEKFKNAIYLIAAISSIGILYHFILIFSGQLISPIPIPLISNILPMPRMVEMGFRPVSFFGEPASYADYMLLPMYFVLMKKKYYWYFVCVFFVLLSTSTTGVVSSISLLLFHLYLNKKRSSFFAVFILLGVMYVGLTNLTIFDATISKIENTNVSTNDRMSNGPRIVQQMQAEELVFGINSPHVHDYARANTKLYDHITTFEGEDMFYVSKFWLLIIQYGIVGFILYYFVYIKLMITDRRLIPLIGTLLIFSIFAGAGLSGTFTYYVCASLAFSKTPKI